MKTFVLYHASCADGFGAAFAAWTAYQENATYLPVRYDEPVPEIPDGATVFILDFSYPRSVLLALEARVAMLRVIDHHATAAEELAGLDFATFDQSKSGAVLTWEYFFPETPVPELLLYVQDRDLWRWKLPESREVSAALAMRPFDFDGWLCADVEQLRAEGRIARRVVKQAAERQARHADWREVGGVRVPVVNATMFISETCEEMKSLWPDAPFVASYFVKPNGDRAWSLRCGEDGDVRAVAERLGGGGHRQAAGFTEVAGEGSPSADTLHFAEGMEYYRGLVDQVAAHLGDAAYICDDGGRSESPLRAKVPELVEALAKRDAASEFWGKICYPEGMSAEQVQNELADYRFMLDQVPLVYEAVKREADSRKRSGIQIDLGKLQKL